MGRKWRNCTLLPLRKVVYAWIPTIKSHTPPPYRSFYVLHPIKQRAYFFVFVPQTFHFPHGVIGNLLAFLFLTFCNSLFEFLVRGYYDYGSPLETFKRSHFTPLSGGIHVCLLSIAKINRKYTLQRLFRSTTRNILHGWYKLNLWCCTYMIHGAGPTLSVVKYLSPLASELLFPPNLTPKKYCLYASCPTVYMYTHYIAPLSII